MRLKSTPFFALFVWVLAVHTSGKAAQAPCIEERLLIVNGVGYMGPAQSVEERFGKPAKTVRYLFRSGGNSGDYHVKRLTYPGGIFEVRDEKSHDNLVERLTLSTSAFSLNDVIRIGQTKKTILGLLGIQSEKEVMSIAEARIAYEGGRPHLASKKSNWSLESCTMYRESTSIEFYFDKRERLRKINIYHDDSAI